MNTISLAIVTDDYHYAEALSRSLQVVSRGFLPTIHSRDAFLEMWKEKGWDYRETIDLILWDGGEIEDFYGGNLIRLTEKEEGETPREGELRFRLGKYSTVSVLAARLQAIHEELTGQRPAGGTGSADVIAFASWQGGAGCTTLTLAAGQEMTRFFGRRVLAVTLDPVEATTEYMARPRGVAGVEEYLYRLLGSGPEGSMPERSEPVGSMPERSGPVGSRSEGRAPGIAPSPERFLIRDGYGLEALAPSAGRNPLAGLAAGEMDRVLRALGASGRFDTILVDVGPSCTEAALAVLRAADRICLVQRRLQPDREARYRAWLAGELGVEGTAPMLKVGNGRPLGEEEISAARGEEEADRPDIRLAERQTISAEILLEGAFGRDIHALAEKLCYNEQKPV